MSWTDGGFLVLCLEEFGCLNIELAVSGSLMGYGSLLECMTLLARPIYILLRSSSFGNDWKMSVSYLGS